MLLSGASSLGQLVLFLVCSIWLLVQPQMHQFQCIAAWFHHRNFIHASSLMIAFALLNIFWYIAFQVHSVFTDVSFFSGLHVSAMLGDNLPKIIIFQEMLRVPFSFLVGDISTRTSSFCELCCTPCLDIPHQRMGLMCI